MKGKNVWKAKIGKMKRTRKEKEKKEKYCENSNIWLVLNLIKLN